jgi:hypothetical protein
MRHALHSSFTAYRGSFPEVVFVDLADQTAGTREHGVTANSDDGFTVREGIFETIVEIMQLLNRETLTVTQRNVNHSFSLLKRLATLKNFGTLIDLEAAYWPDRFFSLSGQLEQLSRLSAKALLDMLDAMTIQPHQTLAVPHTSPTAIDKTLAAVSSQNTVEQ